MGTEEEYASIHRLRALVDMEGMRMRPGVNCMKTRRGEAVLRHENERGVEGKARWGAEGHVNSQGMRMKPGVNCMKTRRGEAVQRSRGANVGVEGGKRGGGGAWVRNLRMQVIIM